MADGRQARWEQHNSERRRAIIDAAIAVVEAHEPGAEVHVQQIADRAELSRTVVYRHFADRADLDRAVQAAIVDDLAAELLPAVTLDGTVVGIIERIVSTYVSWAVAHPALHRLAESDSGADTLQRGLERIAHQVSEVISFAIDALGLELSEDQSDAIDPLVFGLVGAVFGAVRRWLAREERRPSAPVFVSLVTDSVWFIIHGHARGLGLDLDRDQSVQELLAAVSPS
ncbi:TetR/AcrR family transcriptional regulator [Nocardioides acrostichi]|uniref:TetR/AcrR family transcriptional regulator n=1 Tax=Nocardioides acrostichi TaxID=2784339 RepID=A0A930Y6C9_9ACTN|nr:TetR/AcrR family transcriptional regulator [Nocardioides acrostichi]MBF4162215.1 TetR/AcrR family transcriptional regulator [Nocardioides acrostichi]